MILLLETSDTQNHSCALPCSNFICHCAVNFVDSFNFAGFKWRSFKVRHLTRSVQICASKRPFLLIQSETQVPQSNIRGTLTPFNTSSESDGRTVTDLCWTGPETVRPRTGPGARRRSYGTDVTRMT